MKRPAPARFPIKNLEVAVSIAKRRDAAIDLHNRIQSHEDFVIYGQHANGDVEELFQLATVTIAIRHARMAANIKKEMIEYARWCIDEATKELVNLGVSFE